ncbi:uncharacterized protein Fot_03377 [Forsythia ovata]|uniref:Uncharacterized protein n=1 Tax=Forsythia ovata TaxID=205694 RepID=A0ABD1XCK0_9LAMI
MKNLRLEITQLRRSLEDSRSESERLQSISEQLAKKLAENVLCIEELENREMLSAQNRAAGDRERIQELTRQLEEAEKKDTNRHRVRYICWPWKTFKINPANNTANGIRNVRHMLPEMQALLYYH